MTVITSSFVSPFSHLDVLSVSCLILSRGERWSLMFAINLFRSSGWPLRRAKSARSLSVISSQPLEMKFQAAAEDAKQSSTLLWSVKLAKVFHYIVSCIIMFIPTFVRRCIMDLLSWNLIQPCSNTLDKEHQRTKLPKCSKIHQRIPGIFDLFQAAGLLNSTVCLIVLKSVSCQVFPIFGLTSLLKWGPLRQSWLLWHITFQIRDTRWSKEPLLR